MGLRVTGHHLLLSPGPQASPDLWLLLLRSVDSIKPVAGDFSTITLRCKDLRVLHLDIEGVEATLDISHSIEALSFLESVITSYPFFYRPKDLRWGDAWHFHPPECYYKLMHGRCVEDEELLRAVLAAAPHGAWGFIVDTRSAQTSKQARITGGGTEAKVGYPGWKRLHWPLEKWQPLQESFLHLVEACEDLEQRIDHWLSRLESCHWLAHVKKALSTACLAAQGMEREGAWFLALGAEGTDSTLLVTLLAQLILDPLSQTMAGFQELVEREWIQAGHPFQLHCAHSAFSHTRPKHKAPTFLLFLDCVWQLGRQFPLSLEFGEGLLLALFGHAYASLFGTFLCNSEKERSLCKVRTRAHSLWSGLNQPKEQRKLWNPLYVHNPSAIWPSVEPRSLRLWQGLFLCWTRPPEASEVAWEKVWQIVTDAENTEGSQPTVSASEPQP
ncbi:myotubularin-related protein 9-like [Rousettus aegyptiacus]|uniref:myotubularin-related protein 9-like n=1 Tax=Rousettus aegyptiacus TaxID=9407 RepID=UPI00168D5DF1|nr:myotubularin-related protein 9-like [Rousettus aegyptiacus]